MGQPRISARRGQIADLNITFFRNGVPTDPYAIRRVEIYKTQVAPHNLVTTIPFLDPDDVLYPAPATKISDGKFLLPYMVADDADVPDVYFDVWYYFADNPCDAGTGTGTGGTGGTSGTCDLDDPDLDPLLLSCCNRFWIYPDGWACSNELQEVKFGFEPLDIHFNKPEVRNLEVGLMPLPLYDFNFNLVAPLIPQLTATIKVETRNCELLVDDAVMTIGLRQGSYRTNPFVLRYQLDTSTFLIGTYRYRVTLTLPDGTTRSSKYFIFTVN